MRFGKVAGELQGPVRVRLRLREDVYRAGGGVFAEQQVAIGQSGMGERIGRVERDGLFEQSHRFLQVLRRPLAPEMAALQVQIVRLGTGRRLRRQRRMLEEPGPERVGDGTRQLVLDRKDALQLPVVRLGPQVVSVRGVDQLGGKPQRIALAPDAPLQDGGDGELLADLADAEVLVLVGECRGARDHPEPIDVGERVDHFLGDSVREVLVVLRGAHVHERQDRDRGARGSRGRVRCPARAREVPRNRWNDGEGCDHADGERQRQSP